MSHFTSVLASDRKRLAIPARVLQTLPDSAGISEHWLVITPHDLIFLTSNPSELCQLGFALFCVVLHAATV
jgi:hypothetical protein